MISGRFVWHKMSVDVARWCRDCVPCQASKVQCHVKAPVQQMPVPDAPFKHIHVDIVGPLPMSQGYTNLLTVIDCFTRWPEVFPMRSVTAEDCARELLQGWVSRYGLPTDITSDRGRQFTSTLWHHMAETLGATVHHTCAYHMQSNGMVERWHRSLKASLMARLNHPSWMEQLPWVLLGLRTCPKEDQPASPAEMVFCGRLKVPGDVVPRPPTQTLPPTPKMPKHHARPQSRIPKELWTTPFVFIRKDHHRRPLDRPYSGPFKVLSRADKWFLVDIAGRHDRVWTG